MSDRLWFIKRCRLLETLTEDQLRRLETGAKVREYLAREVIYFPADSRPGLLLVASGRVKLSSVTDDGKEAILAFVEPGEIFGELSLFEEGDREELATAALKSTVVWLPAESFEALLEESASLLLGVTKLFGFRRRRIERRLKGLLFRSVRQRLAHLLAELAESYGKEFADGTELTIGLSHQDLASLIGATRESVTLLLGELQLAGAVRLSRRRIVVLDWSYLDGESRESIREPARTSKAARPATGEVIRADL